MENIIGTFTVLNTEESAGRDPFDHDQGTSFATEWSIKHTLRERPGGQTLGFIYSIDRSRSDITQDPRIFIRDILQGVATPTTEDDVWAFYYNAYQYIYGDSNCGWGPFVRFGFSGSDPNPVSWNASGGLGGKGPFPNRKEDSWGAGIYYVNMNDEDLLQGLRVDEEFGGEIFYNIGVTPYFHVTLDGQVIDSALPLVDTAWVFSVRTLLNF